MRTLLAAGLALLIANVAFAAPPDAILGTWRTEDRHGNRDAIVEIQRDGDAYRAVVVWTKYEVFPPGDPMAGRPVVDRENPDPALRSRPVVGIEMLSGLRHEDGEWIAGELYSPREGSRYGARVKLAGPDRLAVRGYLGTPMLGKTVVWTREAPPADAE